MGESEPKNQEMKMNQKYQLERNYPKLFDEHLQELVNITYPWILGYNIDLDVSLFLSNFFSDSNLSESICKKLNMLISRILI